MRAESQPLYKPVKGCLPFDTNFISPTTPTEWTTFLRN